MREGGTYLHMYFFKQIHLFLPVKVDIGNEKF
jgi:hypothetical protein